MDLSKTLSDILSIDPTAPAIENADGQWWTWGDLSQVVDGLLKAFDDAGLGEGARVGVLFKNRAPQAAALLACAIGKRCAVAVNSLMPADKLRADFDGLGVPMIVGEAGDLDPILDMAKSKGLAIVVLPGLPGAPSALSGFETPRVPSAFASSAGVLIEMLTSGTTGAPKRIPLGLANFQASVGSSTEAYEKGRTADDTPKLRSGIRILQAPLTHISGIFAALTTLAGGRKIAFLEKFKVDEWVSAVDRHKVKLANAPPAALRMILDADVPREKLSSLLALRTGTAPLDPAIADEFLERYDVPVLQTYGATEFAGAVAGWSVGDFRARWKEKRGSVGTITAGIEARIVDPETGTEVPAGDDGVLEVRGRQIGDGSWVRTTDRAALDADGYLFIRGRYDGAIIRGGFKVHADDVVKAMIDHPAIREASVVGIPDRRLGEVPVAALILTAGASAPSDSELSAFLKDRLLPYQVPTRFLYVEDLPRTPSMKPALPAVRALFADAVAA